MPPNRKLAAVLFTDIEGYSAIMQRDELKARTIKDHHRQILKTAHKKYNGTVIHYYGDGTLSVFESAVEAVQCALEMQLAFVNLSIGVRMGLHSGEIVYDDESIFGDSVNIASRIESLGVAGCILLSERIAIEIRNHREFKLASVGRYQFKNIEKEMEVFALCHELLIQPLPDTLKGKTEAKKDREASKITQSNEKSIAVLPFDNMSNDPEQDYFSDGISEEIINSLTHVKGLKVAGRISTFQFKGSKAGIKEIGEKLGVSSVMEGSIRKQGNKLRVTVQLINVSDGFHLWSEKYDRNMDDIFSIQDEIALAITEKLRVVLLEEEREKMTKSHTNNPEAYEFLLKGRYLLNRRGPSILKAIEFFGQAISIDPDLAAAYAGYADSYLLLATYGMVSPKHVMVKAKEAAEKAITLNPSLFEPYSSLGYYYNTFEWNWAEAKKYYCQSLEINPYYCQALSWYGCNFLSWVEGKFDEAEKLGELLIKSEPLSATYYGSYSLILHTSKKLEKALAICQMGIELDPTAFLCRLNEGHIYFSMHKYENAIASFEAAIKISNRHHYAINGLIWANCMMGNFDQATVLMEELRKRAETEYVASMFTGLSASHLGNIEEALIYLEKAFEDREPALLALRYENWGSNALRNHPDFKALLDRIGFPVSSIFE